MSKDGLKANGRDSSLDCPVADDWLLARSSAKVAFDKIHDMHAAMVNLQTDTKNLNQLPLLVEILKTAFESHSTNNKPNPLVNLAVVTLLGIVIIVLILKDAPKDFKLNEKGFEMHHAQPK